MYKYLVAVAKDPEHDKIRAYCEGSVAHFDWLESLGFECERSFFPGKAVIQPGTEGLMFTANEKVWPFRDQARPAPQGHKVPQPGDTGGARLVMDLLRDRVEEAGVEVRYETGATHLVTDESGAVHGLTWRSFGETGVLCAGATVIAAGGFVMNTGLIVNSRGTRFVAEDSYHARTSQFVLEQAGSAAYLIVDSAHAEQPQMPLAPLLDGYETVAEMEAGLGLPTGSLRQTLARYNHHAARGEDPDFHKNADWLAPQDQGPWAVFDLRLGHGACASNIAQDGKGYGSGTQLGEGSFFGRPAGRPARGPAPAQREMTTFLAETPLSCAANPACT